MSIGVQARRLVVAAAAIAVVGAPAAGAFAAKSGGSTGSTCKRSCTDTMPPTIAITTPASGASLSGSVTIGGSASDNTSVAAVSVSIDGGSASNAVGTTSWSYTLNTTSLSNGSHTITAKATDGAGNTSTASEVVTVQNTTSGGSTGSGSWSDLKLANPAGGGALAAVGRGRQAESGSLSALLYAVPYSNQYGVYFRDSSTGSSSYVSLPTDTTAGWSNANYALTTASDLWIESGDGPIYVRHYHFSGSPLPTSASLLTSQTFGDGDSRHGDVTGLASGGVAVVWHQQGDSGPQGQYVAYRSPGGSWQQIGPLQFMPTMASKQVVAQNPGDGSIWVFSDPDAWGAIGAIHLTEGASGLTVDWTNGTFISSTDYGDYGADPENPDLAVAVDPSSATLLLAYEDAHRMQFPNGTIGSYVAIARVDTGAAIRFTSLDTYVERISPLGLSLHNGRIWLAYRPVNSSDYSFDQLYVNSYVNGAWGSPTDLGQVVATSARTGFGLSRSEFSASMSDGALHLFTLS